MSKKFTLIIPEAKYCKVTQDFCVNQTFTHKSGMWFVQVKYNENFQILVVFAPAQPQSEKALNSLIITVDAKSTGNNYNSFKENARQIGSTPAYELHNSVYNFYGGTKAFSINIEIDASSISYPSDQCALVDYNQKMLEGNKLADITIKTANGKSEIRANKFVLSRSPVFDAMLNNHDTKEAQEGIIKINDIQHFVLKEMIHYMYTDQVPKIKQMALELLIAADKYNLPGLMSQCNAFLQSNINITNFARILDTANKLNVADLKEIAIKFIIENHDSAFDSVDWKALKISNVQLGMEVMERCFRIIYKNMPK